MKKLSLLIALTFSGTTHAATDLLQVYQEAVTQDATFQSAKFAHEAGQEKLPQGRAGLLPSISLSGDATRHDVSTEYKSGTAARGKYNSDGYTVSLNQPVYRAQNWAAYGQGKYGVEQVNAQFSGAQQDLALRVAQSYFDVLVSQYNVGLAAAQKESIAEQLAQAKRNFEVGSATITDTHDAQARYDLVISQEIAAQNDLEIKQRALQEIIGHFPGELVSIKSDVPLISPQPTSMDAWVEKAMTQNPDVLSARAALDIANEGVNSARGGHYPTLDLVATYGDTSSGGTAVGAGTQGGYDSTAKTVGLQLNLPIFQGGATSSKVREAVANQAKARSDLDAVQRRVASQTRQAYLGVTSGIAQVKALQQAVISNQSSLDSTKLGLEVGVRTSVDLLNARQQLFSARRDLAQAMYAYIISKLKLESAVGDLNEADMKQVNEWLHQAVAEPVPPAMSKR